MRRLRVAIHAQISPDSGAGGVESVLIGLITALAKLPDSREEYVIVGPASNPEWLRPYLGANMKLVSPLSATPDRQPLATLKRRIRRRLASIYYEARNLFSPISERHYRVSGEPMHFYDKLRCDVVHVPYQELIMCSTPTVFNPHDLQHLHYPEFFNREIIDNRERIYPEACRRAQCIVVGSHWIREDVVQQYGVDRNKLQIIPWAPPTLAYAAPDDTMRDEVRRKYSLPQAYAFYPAVTWEHKNHIRLLKAIAQLRDREGVHINLVCSGAHYPAHWPKVQACLDEFGLQDQVQFVGKVPGSELRALYRLAQFVVVPTLFEAASGPMFEAWEEGAPVACSAVTSLPEQAGDAALLFDPLSIDAIADALRMMAGSELLRSELVAKGRLRLTDFSWERTARAYRAVYRKAAGFRLNDEDRHLLSWDWMAAPETLYGVD
jgi:glycosyltransferase involved in cell wall biosynthesis